MNAASRDLILSRDLSRLIRRAIGGWICNLQSACNLNFARSFRASRSALSVHGEREEILIASILIR